MVIALWFTDEATEALVGYESFTRLSLLWKGEPGFKSKRWVWDLLSGARSGLWDTAAEFLNWGVMITSSSSLLSFLLPHFCWPGHHPGSNADDEQSKRQQRQTGETGRAGSRDRKSRPLGTWRLMERRKTTHVPIGSSEICSLELWEKIKLVLYSWQIVSSRSQK